MCQNVQTKNKFKEIILAKQDRARDSSKNIRFLCYEGSSIFSTDFKRNKNVI